MSTAGNSRDAGLLQPAHAGNASAQKSPSCGGGARNPALEHAAPAAWGSVERLPSTQARYCGRRGSWLLFPVPHHCSLPGPLAGPSPARRAAQRSRGTVPRWTPVAAAWGGLRERELISFSWGSSRETACSRSCLKVSAKRSQSSSSCVRASTEQGETVSHPSDESSLPSARSHPQAQSGPNGHLACLTQGTMGTAGLRPAWARERGLSTHSAGRDGLTHSLHTGEGSPGRSQNALTQGKGPRREQTSARAGLPGCGLSSPPLPKPPRGAG